MFENFPYTDMHQLNLDWIVKIAKDFLEQYTHIQQLISDGEQSLQDLTTEGLASLQEKADNLEALLQQWYDTHSQDIANELTSAIQELQAELSSVLSDFNAAADLKAAQTIASIPDDYTTLSNNVLNLTNDFEILFSGTKTGDVSSYSGLTIAEFTDIHLGDIYKIYVWDLNGLDLNNVQLYLYRSDNTYIDYTPERINLSNSCYWIFAMPQSGSFSKLRIYATKLAGATLASAKFAYVRSTGGILNASEEITLEKAALAVDITGKKTGNVANYSGITIVEYPGIIPGMEYKVYTWNLSGLNIENAQLYGMRQDNTYYDFTSERKISNGSAVWDITIPTNENIVSLRIYIGKLSGATIGSAEYAITKANGGILNAAIDLRKPINNKTTCKIFKKVVCCGDSYTSGHIQAPGESTASPTNEQFAWPHFMETLTGNEYVNCGRSGANTRSWQTDPRGLPKAQAAGSAQAYIIGLGINDASIGSMHIDVGTASDIGTTNNTYYGNLSTIIRELNTITPTAKIFVFTCPKDPTVFGPYNQAVRDIVTAYQNTYPIHCIDLADNAELFNIPSIENDASNGHYTAVGYEQFAEIISYLISEYINNHISQFQDVYKIPY